VSSSEKTTRTHLIKRQLEVLSPQAGLRQAIGLTETAMNNYDLVILDIMAPGMNGLEVCRRIRARTNCTPILTLIAQLTEFDRVAPKVLAKVWPWPVK
jgi:DNA-binding response OmpR family regulator